MKRILALVYVFCFMGLSATHAQGVASHSDKQHKLPFDLKESELAQVEVTYLFDSQKLNSGEQEISVSGKGKVQLRRTLSMDDRPETKDGKVAGNIVVALLAMIEETNFLGLEKEYPPGGDTHGYCKITIKLPKLTKTVVAVYGSAPPEFENAAGAIKVVAGVALPVALGHRFFPNL